MTTRHALSRMYGGRENSMRPLVSMVGPQSISEVISGNFAVYVLYF